MAGQTKVVFVGNLPYSQSDEQLAEVFSAVGPVSSFRVAFDKDTGKPRGFGFCEYYDPQTAEAAVRNLQGVEVGGRSLRLDFADVGNADTRDAGGRPPPPPRSRYDQHGAGAGGAGAAPGDKLIPPDLPTGVKLQHGQSATDSISQTLATLPPHQLLDIMSYIKGLAISSPDQVRALLGSNPQLTYAIFQAMLMIGAVDASVLARMLQSGTTAAAPAAAPAPVPPPAAAAPPPAAAPQGYGGYPGPQGGYGVPPQTYPAPPAYGAPPPGYVHHQPTPPHMPTPPYGGSAPAPAVISHAPTPQPPAAAALPPQQAQLIQQVMQLTQAQIDALPPDQKNIVLQIRSQGLMR